MLKIYSAFIFVIFTSIIVNGYAASSLSKANVEKLVTSFHITVAEQDAEAVERFFTDDATIKIVMSSKSMTMDVTQFLQTLEQGWNAIKDYSHELENIDVTLSENGKSAQVKDTLTEVSNFGNMTLTTKSQQNFTISLINGKPLIIKIVSTIENME